MSYLQPRLSKIYNSHCRTGMVSKDFISLLYEMLSSAIFGFWGGDASLMQPFPPSWACIF